MMNVIRGMIAQKLFMIAERQIPTFRLLRFTPVNFLPLSRHQLGRETKG
jgi:hypothetical protein